MDKNPHQKYVDDLERDIWHDPVPSVGQLIGQTIVAAFIVLPWLWLIALAM